MPEHGYTPGDAPVPVGTVIDYFGSLTHGRYEITGHATPDLLGYPVEMLDHFPDAPGYTIWKVGAVRKSGNSSGNAAHNVRRTSFRVVKFLEKGESNARE